MKCLRHSARLGVLLAIGFACSANTHSAQTEAPLATPAAAKSRTESPDGWKLVAGCICGLVAIPFLFMGTLMVRDEAEKLEQALVALRQSSINARARAWIRLRSLFGIIRSMATRWIDSLIRPVGLSAAVCFALASYALSFSMLMALSELSWPAVVLFGIGIVCFGLGLGPARYPWLRHGTRFVAVIGVVFAGLGAASQLFLERTDIGAAMTFLFMATVLCASGWYVFARAFRSGSGQRSWRMVVAVIAVWSAPLLLGKEFGYRWLVNVGLVHAAFLVMTVPTILVQFVPAALVFVAASFGSRTARAALEDELVSNKEMWRRVGLVFLFAALALTGLALELPWSDLLPV